MLKKLEEIFGSLRKLDSVIRQIINFLIFENSALFSFTVVAALTVFLIKAGSQIDIDRKLSIILTSVGSLTILLTFVVSHRTSTIRHYTEREGEIFLLEKSHIQLLAQIQFDDYKKLDVKNGDFYTYELIAHQSVKLCSAIYKENLWKTTLRNNFIPFFERVRRTHWNWFKDNASLFQKDFSIFMKYAKWRDLLSLEQADQLRWIYEVDLYDKIVLSPLHPELKLKLETLIKEAIEKKTNGGDNLRVIDLGCGNGNLIEVLVQLPNIKEIVGLDYSPNMIVQAEKKIKAIENNTKKITFLNADMKDDIDITEQFDIAFSINSILPRNPRDLPKILSQISKLVKDKGLFISILPSFDTVLDLKQLDEERLRKQYIADGINNPHKKARRKISKLYKSRKLNIRQGTYADDGVNPQRFFKENEISSLFSKVALDTITLSKFFYPWEICKQYNWGYHPSTKPAIYDWFFVAEKK